MPARTAGAALRVLRRRFDEAGIADAALDARLLVAEAAGHTVQDILLHPERVLADEALGQLEQLAARRLAGEPVGRILGRRDFWGLTFSLSPETLEPRPDTETLVEAVLQHVDAQRTREAPLVFADLGTGTGAIAVALLAELPKARALVTDLAEGALATARANARRHGVAERLQVVRCDFGQALTGGLDLVVSNPPYIAQGERDDLAREVRDHDPALALFAGVDGLDAYRSIVDDLPRLLRPGGVVFLEIGHLQAAAVSALLEAAGLEEIQICQDLGGRDRVVSGRCVAK